MTHSQAPVSPDSSSGRHSESAAERDGTSAERSDTAVEHGATGHSTATAEETGIELPGGFDVLAGDVELSEAVTAALAQVESELLEAISSPDELTNTAGRYLAEAGGKRVRPLLTVLSSFLGSGVNSQVCKAAVVMEMTHLATLYHDDVMDSAPMRRGGPSAHEVWGNSVAILTGDLILARASSMMTDLSSEGSRIHSETFERLVLGQFYESVGPKGDDDPYEHYLSVISNKTGSLLAAAAKLGALYSEADNTIPAMLERYGEAVGIAFQLADDVIDFTADPDVSGKTPGTDLRQGVPTLPVLLLRRAAVDDAEAAALVARIDGDLSDDVELDATVAGIVKHPVMTESRTIAAQWSERAIEAMTELPPSTVRDALIGFARATVERLG